MAEGGGFDIGDSATTALGSLGSVGGGLVAGHLNRKFAREMAGYSVNLANSAYQRQVKDMNAAGLNPMLAITGSGGASTPPFMMGNQPDLDLDLAGTGKKIAEGGVARAQKLGVVQGTKTSAAQAGVYAAQEEKLKEETKQLEAWGNPYEDASETYKSARDIWERLKVGGRAALDEMAAPKTRGTKSGTPKPKDWRKQLEKNRARIKARKRPIEVHRRN